jgi:hypothetical protein
MGSFYVLKGHSASGQGGSSWSSPLRSVVSQDYQVGEAGPVEPLPRPRVIKLGLKGLSDHSNEIAFEVARWEASGPNNRAIFTEYLLKKRELENSSKPNQTGKTQHTSGNTTSKKELLALSPGNVAEGSDDVGEDDDE